MKQIWRRIWTLALATGPAIGVALEAATVTLTPNADTWIDGLSSVRVRGSDQRLGICPVADYWIYLKFDVGSVSGKVTAAELRMSRVDGNRPEELSVYPIEEDDWTESELTGPTRPRPQNPTPEEALAKGSEEAEFDRWSSDALLGFVMAELEGDGVLSLMVREDPATGIDVRHYFSREAPIDSAKHPQLVLTVEQLETVHPEWAVAEVGVGTKPSFDFDANNHLHVMGMTEEQDGYVWHATASHFEAPWKLQEVARGYFYGPGDLRVAPGGRAHIAWHNHDTEDADHVVVHADGSVERHQIETPGLHDGWDNSLALDPMGGLHQAAVYPIAFGANESLQYGKFDGTSWSFQSALPGTEAFMYGLNTSVAIDRMGNVHIVYCQSDDWRTPGDLKYATNKEGSWEVATIVTGGIRGRFPTLALDHWDRPHVAWLDLDEEEETAGMVRYGVLGADGWVIETIGALENLELGHFGARKSVSLALDQNFRPHVAYSDRRQIVYASKPFDSWQTETVLSHGEATYNGLVVLRLDSADRPGIVFWQPAQEEVGVVRLARPRDSQIQLFAPSFDPDSNQISLSWSSGPADSTYAVEALDAFHVGSWETVFGPEPLQDRTWTVPLSEDIASRFFRVRSQTR